MVSQLAKSTPLSERRACATEAFYTAVQRYCPACGDLETYLQEHIQRELLLENKQHVAAYSHLSLDQPLQEGCLLSSIAEELNLTEDEITAMGSEIGRKRKAFYDVN